MDPNNVPSEIADSIERADGFARVFPEHKYVKTAESEMSAFIFGEYRASDLIAYLGKKEDEAAFFAKSEADRIRFLFSNRGHIRVAPSKILKLQIPLALEIRPWKRCPVV
jgi:hypothetical protein